jgi:hypothetical protein
VNVAIEVSYNCAIFLVAPRRNLVPRFVKLGSGMSFGRFRVEGRRLPSIEKERHNGTAAGGHGRFPNFLAECQSLLFHET